MPTSPRTSAIAEASFYAKDGHQGVIEGQRTLEVSYANKYMRKH
jgi:hypothetical protein